MFTRPNIYGFQLPAQAMPMAQRMGGGGMPMGGNPLMAQQKPPANPLSDPAAMAALKTAFAPQQGGNPMNGASQQPNPMNGPPQMDNIAQANMNAEQPPQQPNFNQVMQNTLQMGQQQPDWMMRNLGFNFGQ